MTKSEKDDCIIISKMIASVEKELFQILKNQEFQIDALKKENAHIRDSLEKVEPSIT